MLPFDLPPPIGYSFSPKWDGQNFVFGEQRTPVLEYSENFSGWSDDLTSLHEEVVGDSHPIDIASRYDAILQVKKFMSYTHSVIMEIGCSSGFLIKDLVETYPQAIIVGADVVRDPLFRLAKTLPGIPLIRFDLLQCPLPNQCVDVLIMLNVLEHIQSDVAALGKAFNLLKPGGVLIIEVPAGPSLYDSYDVELQHFRRYSDLDLQTKLVESGFVIRRRSHLGFILFPAFAVVKLLNKWLTARKKTLVVRKRASNTSSSRLVKIAMKLESRILVNLQLPFGVRALITAQRPA